MKQIYSLRKDFTIIGLTGTMGSGCSKVAEILSLDNTNFFKSIDLRLPSSIRLKDDKENIVYENILFQRKYSICFEFMQKNRNKFIFIDYKKVLFLYIFDYYINVKKTRRFESDLKLFLIDNFKQAKNNDGGKFDDKNKLLTEKELKNILKRKNSNLEDLIKEIKSFKHANGLLELKDPKKLANLYSVFFTSSSNFNKLFIRILKLLTKKNYYLRALFFHNIACNIRTSGKPEIDRGSSSMEHVYNTAKLINRLIKAYKTSNHENVPCHIVINSLKNSLEIMYFKERYSAFYMMAVHSERARELTFQDIVKDKNDKESTVERLLNLDSIEYKTRDFKDGLFSSPDIENCIQKSDIHLINRQAINFTVNNPTDFYSFHEQLMKYLSLIQQPGIITPSNTERCMQMAFNSKLNSGCISRQVGAVVTDGGFAVKSVGWNDTPKKTIPCLLRNVEEVINGPILDKNDSTYSEFELPLSKFKYKLNSNKFNAQNKETNLEHEGINFSQNVSKIYTSDKLLAVKAEGKNCSYCFKTLHNKFEGEDNQIHTRSLHAEENAMLQISKFGGQGLKNGFLFTTASPCELCSKKAYQLGIKKVFYIDKYPGISKEHIIGVGFDAPELIQFSGVIGRSFNKLYEPFMAYKDELSLYLK